MNYFSSSLIEDLLCDVKVDDFGGIIIVDNSNDTDEWRNVEVLASQNSVRCVRMEYNAGFGAGVNCGVKSLGLKSSEYVWVLNPDTRIERDSAARLVKAIDEHRADIVSPLIVTDPDGQVWFGGGDLDLKRGRTSHRVTTPHKVEECSFLTGAAMMLRGASWHRLGGFREDLFMYWEDADLCIRARDLGMTMMIAPDVTIWHAVGATSSASGKSELYYFYMQRNRMMVIASSFGIGGLLHPLAIAELMRIFLRTFKEDERPLSKARAAARGVLAGFQYAVGQFKAGSPVFRGPAAS
ncbi:glycosyltransferase family 2 protein [Rhodococcus pyridinivorans]|nr:glycosyltransferase family 2 protein [Rhodococcus pyridinivorans]MCW3468054.1 glycosyltransferase family 2 protein [Rhodococcus pyridinivorans]